MISITNKKKTTYIKKLNEDIINYWNFLDLKALNFTELNKPDELLNFINNCINFCESKYNKEKIEDIIFDNKYLAYIFYQNDNPLGYLISYIVEKNDKKILEIENLGVLKHYKEKSLELDFIKIIILKAWENKGVDKITINFKSTENKIENIMNELKFKRTE